MIEKLTVMLGIFICAVFVGFGVAHILIPILGLAGLIYLIRRYQDG